MKTERYTKGKFDGSRVYSVQYNVYTHIRDGLSHPNAILIQTFNIFLSQYKYGG